jgi:GNAT superfamily N-acetyltransferase
MNVLPVTPDRWKDMVELFERRGPRGGRRNTKKRAMAKLVRDRCEPGLLAYDDGGSPVGWISIAPREEYTAILASPQDAPRDDDAGVWSIVCFVVDRPVWRTGVAAALLDAAVEHAFSRGATAVEAYPHVSNGSDDMGPLGLFERAGFTKMRTANKRVIVRRG